MFRSDYYSVLGVSRGASVEDIGRAYRRLVRTWHPDVNPTSSEAEGRLRVLIEAYETLRDPISREIYDEALPPPIIQDLQPRTSRIPSSIKARKQAAIVPGLATIALIAAVIFLAAKLWHVDPVPVEWTKGKALPAAYQTYEKRGN